MSITTEQLRNAYHQSGNVYSGSEKLGRIGQIYLDERTAEPTWITVKNGLFGTSESFIPLYHARVEGNDILVDYDQETIKNAPRIEADDDLTPREELDLFRYYSRSRDSGTSDRDTFDRDAFDRDRDQLDRNDVTEEHAGNEPARGRLRRFFVTRVTEEPIQDDRAGDNPARR
jgi:hypothetical protein